jgi:hypothetical protein
MNRNTSKNNDSGQSRGGAPTRTADFLRAAEP